MANYTKNLGLELPEKNEFYSIEKINANSEKIDSVAHNENLLDNPWFTVNQRGVTSWIGRSNYGVDRWRGYGTTSTQTVSTDSKNRTIITISNSSEVGGVQQYIPRGEVEWGEQMTASVMTSNGKVYFFTFTPSASDTWMDSVAFGGIKDSDGNKLENCSLSVGGGNDTELSTRITFVFYTTLSSISVLAMKLEYGPHSTLANDIAPDYATELLKCQRYFESIQIGGNNFLVCRFNGNNYHARIDYKVRKRTTPTITRESTIDDYPNGRIVNTSSTNIVATSVSYVGTSAVSTSIKFGYSSNVGDCVMVDNVGILYISADL